MQDTIVCQFEIKILPGAVLLKGFGFEVSVKIILVI